MKKQIFAFFLGVVALAVPAFAQSAQLPAPSPIEKELAARASHVTEVTLDKNTLAFASRFMHKTDTSINPLYRRDEEATRQFIDGLEGIYVREYEFDKDDQISAEQVDQLRKYFATGEWSTLMRERDRKGRDSTEVMVKQDKGAARGLFILEVEPRELTIVLILGPIRLEDLSKLKGISGLGDALGGIEFKTKASDKKGGKQ